MNLDFSINNYASIGEPYRVTLCVDGRLYEYSVFCLDHWQALQLAIADHRAAGHHLPLVTGCLVDGPCHDRGATVADGCISKSISLCSETKSRRLTD
jgi:hypothetical protein